MKKNNINTNRLQTGSRRLLAKITLISAIVVSLVVMSCGNGLSFSNKDDTKLTACSDVSQSRSSSLYSISMRITCSFGTNDLAAPITSAMPAGGVYGSTFPISFVSNELVTTYYTVDGSVPTTASPVYSVPFTIAATTTLRYFSVDTSGNTSQLRSVGYVIDSSKDSLFVTSQESFFAGLGSNSVQETTSAKITWSSTQVGTVVIKAGYGDISGAVEISTFSYTGGPITTAINGSDLQPGLNNVFLYFQAGGESAGYLQVEVNKDGVYPNTVPSVDEGYFQAAINVTLATNEGARTFYTLDGSDPLTSGSVVQYSGAPIAIGGASIKTFKFYSIDYAGNVEPVRTYTYVFDATLPYFTTLPPSVPAPEAVAYVSTKVGSTDLVVNFVVNDNDTGVAYHQIEICADATCTAPGSGTKILREAVSAGGALSKSVTETINQTEVNEGRNWIFVYNVDLAGNFALYKFTLIKDSTAKVPVPIYPETGQYVKTGTVNFAFTNTCPTETIVAGGSYEDFTELEVDNNADFSSPEVSNTITFTHGDPEACTGLTAKDPVNNYYINAVAAGLTGGTKYYYRVRMTDKAGNVSPYSSGVPFYYGVAKNDVNGDGFSDIVVGVPLFDQDLVANGNEDGKVYIYFGGAGATMNIVPDVVINSDFSGSRNELFGSSVDFLANPDGSGKVGLVVGAKGNQAALNGRVYVFFDIDTKCISIYPCSLDYTDANVTISGVSGDELGTVVKGLGDINNDGFSDFAISAPAHDPSINNAGSVFIYYGKATASWSVSIDISGDPTAEANFKLSGQAAGEKMGLSIGTLGDINKDGYLDFMIGSPSNTPNSITKAGTSYIVKGGNLGNVTLDYTYNGSAAQDLFGTRISGGADFNNDGYSDFLVSSIQYSAGAFLNEGQVSMFLGGNDNTLLDYYSASVFPVTATDSIEGGVASVKLADSLASVPNLDSTNKAGFIACSIVYDNGGNTGAGQCFLHTVSGTALSANVNSNLIGTSTGQKFGGAARYVGDVNGDGCGDFAISSLGPTQGTVDVYFGRGASCGGGSIATIASNGTLTGENNGDEFGTALGGE